ncbi:MAG: hypothetical protein IJ679_09105 [Lachnospiraceae bacterium]|nr:hypothetical protein [Lachnospiraceae bacterium]
MASAKEYVGNLFDQLEIIEDALELIKEDPEKAIKYLEKKKMRVERKLYQNPPLYEDSEI